MAKLFLCLNLLCGLTTVIACASECTSYVIRPSQSQSCPDDRYSSATACVDNELTLSQFINNSSDYLTNDTTLIFSPGNYSLESEIVVENVHSFSMFVWPASSSKIVITCGHNARFAFRNVSIVTVSGLEFVKCFENHVLSVGQFQLENSRFFGNGPVIVSGTVLSIEESVANLDRVAFISAVEKLQTNATPQVSEDCYARKIETTNAVIGILLRRSNVTISQSQFEGNTVGLGAVIYDDFGSDIVISNTIFVNNTAEQYCSSYCCFPSGIVYVSGQHRSTVKIYQSKFEGNIGVAIIIYGDNTYISEVSIIHSEFVDNTAIGPQTSITGSFWSSSLISLHRVMTTVSSSDFINNRVRIALVYARYYTTLTNNVFVDNSAAYEVFIASRCRPGLSLSLGSSRCIQCSENWRRDLAGTVVAAFIAGIALVIFMLALNMTVAVGSINGILFYAHIVAANADTYFLPFISPDFVTVFISWLNLEIGFDICFLDSRPDTVSLNDLHVHKALLQLAFPAYVVFLVIVVIVASECSSKFAKMVGKGNPVAVLATLILITYARFFNVILTSVSLLYFQPAYGSYISLFVVFTRLPNVIVAIEETKSTEFKAVTYFLSIVSTLVLFLCVIFTVFVFSWQWLLRYQNKTIFKWVRYQKLQLFLEPYHAPYTAKYRFWTGLLLFVRALLYLISVMNFSLDPRVDLLSVILVVGGLILLKGVIAKRVYKNWPLDVMETAIYFNLVTFSSLTWYNLDFGGNQVAAADTSVMIIFILLLGIIVFHVLRYTRLYKLSFVEKAFKWTSFKLLKKKLKEQPPNDAPEELDGYQLERSVAGAQELPTIIHSVIEINQSAQNQEENHTG